VRYVLEGSIRRSGDRIRITGQLIDATTGAHRWAERYDRKLEDVFAVQDEVARNIVAILAAHVNKTETERTLLKPPATWQAYDYYMRGADVVASFFSSWKVEELYDLADVRRFSLVLEA
jgi:adenylate cyclase